MCICASLFVCVMSLSLCVSVYVIVCVSCVCASVCLCVWLYVFLCVCLSVCMYAHQLCPVMPLWRPLRASEKEVSLNLGLTLCVDSRVWRDREVAS